MRIEKTVCDFPGCGVEHQSYGVPDGWVSLSLTSNHGSREDAQGDYCPAHASRAQEAFKDALRQLVFKRPIAEPAA